MIGTNSCQPTWATRISEIEAMLPLMALLRPQENGSPHKLAQEQNFSRIAEHRRNSKEYGLSLLVIMKVSLLYK